MYNVNIENVGFTKIQYRQLKTNGYNTLRDICSENKDILISKLGKQAYYSIKRKLHQIGFMFDDEIILYEKIKISLKQELEVPIDTLDLGELLFNSILSYFDIKYNKNTFNYRDIIEFSKNEFIETYFVRPAHINELLFIIHKLGLKVKEEINIDLKIEVPEYRCIFEKEERERNKKSKINKLANFLSEKTIIELEKFGYITIEDICSITIEDFMFQIDDKDMQLEVFNLLNYMGLTFIETYNQNDIDRQIDLYVEKLNDINISSNIKREKLLMLKKMILDYEKRVKIELEEEKAINKYSQRTEELVYILNKGKKLKN